MDYIEKFDNFFTYKNLFIYELVKDDGLTWISQKRHIIPMVIEDKEIGTPRSTAHILLNGDLKTYKTFEKCEYSIPYTFKVIKVFNREHLLDLLDYI